MGHDSLTEEMLVLDFRYQKISLRRFTPGAWESLGVRGPLMWMYMSMTDHLPDGQRQAAHVGLGAGNGWDRGDARAGPAR